MPYEQTLQISPHRSFTSEGFLVCTDCALARTGQRTYLGIEIKSVKPDDKGEVTIVRDASSLFDPLAMASIEGKAVTLSHPPEDVTIANYKKFAVGSIHNVRRGTNERADELLADLILTDPAAIDAVMSGAAQELSLGYDAGFKDLGGGRGAEEWIRANHAALVPKGRCGPGCRILDNLPVEDKTMDNPNKSGTAPTQTDQKPGDNQPDFGKVLKALTEQVASLSKRLETIETKKKEDGDKKDDAKQGEGGEGKPGEGQPVKDAHYTQIIKDEVKKALQDALKTEKATAEVVRDAAIVAPELSSSAPNLALEALKHYGKTAEHAKVLEAWGGIEHITDAEAPAILKALAGLVRAQNSASQSAGRTQTPAIDPAQDFFNQARKLWGRN